MTDTETMTARALARAEALACWSMPVRAEALPGGLSNANFTVSDGGRRFVVRIGADVPEHGVYRVNEHLVSQAAHAAGLSPEVHHHEDDALVLAYIEGGVALEPKAVRRPDRLARIVELIRRCHTELPRYLQRPAQMFWVFEASRRYRRLLARGHNRLANEMSALMADNDQLENIVGPIRPVFCHNDLLAANLIDDGARLWLIDWEYGGWNAALFDLANLAGNNGFTREDEHRLLRLYCRAEPDGGLLRRFDAMKAASLLREALWSLVSEIHSALDIDYAAYTDENLERYRRVRAEVLG